MDNVHWMSAAMPLALRNQPEIGAERPRIWRFIEIRGRRLAWERTDSERCSTRVGPFDDLAECVRDAAAHGYDEALLERRKQPRAR
jgi:hypothetical protein